MEALETAFWHWKIQQAFGEKARAREFCESVTMVFNCGGLRDMDPPAIKKIKGPWKFLPSGKFTGKIIIDINTFNGGLKKTVIPK